MGKAGRQALALPLYALAYVLAIPLLVGGAVIAAAVGVVFMALLLPLLLVLGCLELWRPGTFAGFFDWLSENNPINVLMLLGPVTWLGRMAQKVAESE